MRQNPPTRKLREHPDLDQLRRQAKELLQAFLGWRGGCRNRGKGALPQRAPLAAHQRDKACTARTTATTIISISVAEFPFVHDVVFESSEQ